MQRRTREPYLAVGTLVSGFKEVSHGEESKTYTHTHTAQLSSCTCQDNTNVRVLQQSATPNANRMQAQWISSTVSDTMCRPGSMHNGYTPRQTRATPERNGTILVPYALMQHLFVAAECG